MSASYYNIGAIVQRLQKGETANLAIANERQIDDLIKQGKIVAGSQSKVAKVGIGVGVRKGAPKPDISSLDSFKRSLVAAKAIGLLDPATGSPTGRYLVAAFDRLGWMSDLKAKIRPAPTVPALFDALVQGDTQIALMQASEIANDTRLELAGSPPGALANSTVFMVGVVASGRERQAGMALITYLTTPAAVAVFKAHRMGLE